MAKSGKTLVELATEIQRQADVKKDFVAPVGLLEMQVHPSVVTPSMSADDVTGPRVLLGLGAKSYPVLPFAHGQIAETLDVPKKYYDRMLSDAPDLLAHNVNTWLDRMARDTKNAARLVRTLDGNVRAFLSDRYRTLENIDLAEAVLPVLQRLDLLILSMEITDRRLYIKAVDRSIEKNVPTGRKMGDGSHVFFDTLSPAITISNSEVGCGALSVETGIYTKVCTNLAMIGTNIRKYHTGGRADISSEVYALLTDKTKALADAALWSQLQDLVTASFDRARFEALTEKVAETVEQKVPVASINEVIEVTSKRFGFTQGEGKSVLGHFIETGDFSRYGLFNAVTRSAEDHPDYDRATELERVGGRIIELPQGEWKEILKAAA